MKPCRTYKEEFISRFVDNEISRSDQDNFIRHMEGCRACTETCARFIQANQAFVDHLTAQTHGISPISLERRQARPSRGIVLKLAALGTAALIFTIALFPWRQDPVGEPSAIVNSVDTYGSSVMIIDTQDSQHTIIWFSET